MRDVVSELEELSQAVLRQVRARTPAREIEAAVLKGLALSAEAEQQLSLQLESAQHGRGDEAAYLAEALEIAEQKLTFFLGCTMRRSVAAELRRGDDAERHAAAAERLADEVCATGAIDQLVEGYKALEGLEARIVEARGAIKSGSTAPEPRVLDLPRARVLAARRQVGAAVVALDGEDEGDDFT